jgi:hypothetical protein
MAIAGSPARKKPSSAYAAAAAAKQRRQMIFVGLLLVALIAVLAYESPMILKIVRGSSNSSSSSATETTPVTTTPAPGAQQSLKALRHAPASDPFTVAAPGLREPGFRDVSVPPGSHDPFASPGASGSTPTVSASAVPEQIVIGTPGGNRKARHGWIVILASIPTGNGRASAIRFAASAVRSGIGAVSVLNSSNRRPLRGGYWVVYVGPYKTLNEVSSQASHVHSLGYATAYVRELIVYS